MRILVVEDDSALRQQLMDQLVGAGYVVDAAADGAEGEYLGCEFNFDAAIVDLGLPKIDGLELIRRLREQQKTFPIIVLTARGHWQDKVHGLEAGADDYLAKPFEMAELFARLNALIRRAAGFASPVLAAGSLTLDTARQQVVVDDRALELTAFEYRVLEYLMLNTDRIVSKNELTEHLYAQDFDRDSNVIEVFVGRLRRKLEPLKLIRTVRGQGYLLSATENNSVADA
ncbi:MAG: response regulator [Proteobacteria bacterium]|nr:response regulator [Pseudomonadota bacterium]